MLIKETVNFDATSPPHSDSKASLAMGLSYGLYHWLVAKPIELLSYAKVLESDDLDKVWAMSAVFLGSRAYAGLVRYTATKYIGNYYNADTSRSRIFSLIPYMDNLAPLIQGGAFFKKMGGGMLRSAATASTLHPDTRINCLLYLFNS